MPRSSLRLIDYEYAESTHFSSGDWLRVVEFSILPPGLDRGTIPAVTSRRVPWREVHFWLHHLMQLKQAELTDAARQHVGEAVGRLLQAFSQIAPATGGKGQSSLLLALAGENHRQTHQQLEERSTWARSLDGELQAARQNYTKLAAEFEARTAWAKSLESELEKMRETLSSSIWARAKSLEADLESTRSTLAEQAKLVEERTAWAKSLDADLENARATLAEQAKLGDERTAWAQRLDDELTQARAEIARRQHEHEHNLSWAKSLETDVQNARSAFAEQMKVVDERTAWAHQLDGELQAARQNYTKLAAEFEERTTWARSLEAELREVRALYQQQTQMVAQLNDERGRLHGEISSLVELKVKIESELAEIKDACAALAAAIPTSLEKGEPAVLQQGLQNLMDLRRDLAASNADLNTAKASILETTLRAETGESTARRLDAALSDAQQHIEGLIRHAEELQQRFNALGELKTRTDDVLREKELQLVASAAELQATQNELSRYESRLICRLMARRPDSKIVLPPPA